MGKLVVFYPRTNSYKFVGSSASQVHGDSDRFHSLPFLPSLIYCRFFESTKFSLLPPCLCYTFVLVKQIDHGSMSLVHDEKN